MIASFFFAHGLLTTSYRSERLFLIILELGHSQHAYMIVAFPMIRVIKPRHTRLGDLNGSTARRSLAE